MTHLMNSEIKRLKKSLNDLFPIRIVQRLSDDQKQEIYKELISRFFQNDPTKSNLDADPNDANKLFPFDLMRSKLIEIAKLIYEKFKQLDNLENDEEEEKLIRVLNNIIDQPITSPYLLTPLCECISSSIKLLFKPSNNVKLIEVKIDEKFNKKVSDEKVDPPQIEDSSKNNSKKVYKIYSSNKTSEYYESKRTTTKKINNREDKERDERKIEEIVIESSKLHQLNQQYRKNKEEMENELTIMKEKYHRLMHELNEKNLIIDEKQLETESFMVELNTIKVQLESIKKQNQLLDTDKFNLSSNACDLQRKIQELERQNFDKKDECFKLRQTIKQREEDLYMLKREFNDEKFNFEKQKNQLRDSIDEERKFKMKFEQYDLQEKEIRLKYEKKIKELELKQESLNKHLADQKQEIESLRTKFDEKLQENFRINLELKESRLKMENLSKDKDEDQEQLKKCNEERCSLVKRLDSNIQELNKLKKLNFDSNELIKSKEMEIEHSKSELNSLRNENIEIMNKLMAQKNEISKQSVLAKKMVANELKEKNEKLDRLNESLNDLKKECNSLNQERNIWLKLFNYVEMINKPTNQSLPISLNQELIGRVDLNQQTILKYEHYLDVIKELRTEFEIKVQEVKRLKESTKLMENEYEEQKNFLSSIQQKLASNGSQLKIKNCELIHLRDELAENKVKRNENEMEKLNLMRENENLRSEKSSLELSKLELQKQITNFQLRNIDLEKELQNNLSKFIDLDKYTNELNDRCQKMNDELKTVNERLVESLSLKDQLERELKVVDQKLKDAEKLCENEKEISSGLTKVHQQILDEKRKLETNLSQLRSENQQLENELEKIEKEFKDYENDCKRLIDDQSSLIDLVTKYNIIFTSYFGELIQKDENCIEISSNSKGHLKLIKPDCLIQSLLNLQNEQSKSRRQIESLMMRMNEYKMKLKEETDQNQQFRSMIELNESNLMSKKQNYEKLFKEQKEFEEQLKQTLEENDKLKIEKNYLTEKVLNLDKILESTKDFMERKLDETVRCDNKSNLSNHSMLDDQKLKTTIYSLEQYLNQFDQRNEINLNLEDVEMRVMSMHDSLTEFINILVKSINHYKDKINEMTDVNRALNDRLNEMNDLMEKSKTNQCRLELENENLRKKLTTSNHDSKEIENKIKQLTNQTDDLQNECLALQNTLESNRYCSN